MLTRHCEHYFVIAKAANVGLQGPEQADWVWRVETELDNVRAAMAQTLTPTDGVDPFIAVKFSVAMQAFWILRGYSTEGRKFVRSAVQLPAVQASDLAHAWALYVGAALAESQSDHAEVLRLLKTCLELRRGLNNQYDIAATLSTMSSAHLQAGNAEEAEAGEREALQIFRQLGERAAEATVLLNLGQIALYRGDDAQANTHLEQCLIVARAVKSLAIESECELLLGEAAFEAGDFVQAALRFKRSLTMCREGGDKRGEANALWQLGKVELLGGELASARSRLAQALRAFREFEMWEQLLGCLEDQATLARVESRPGAAVRVAAVADLSRSRLGLKRSLRGEQRWQGQLAAIRAALPGAEFEEAWNEGREWQIDQAIRAALSTQAEAVMA